MSLALLFQLNLESAAIAPLFVSASAAADGNSISVVLDQSVSDGGSGLDGWSVTASGGAVTLTYSSGAPGATLVLTTSRTLDYGETLTDLTYVQPGNGVEATDDGTDLVSFSGESVTIRSRIYQSGLFIGIGIRI